MRGMSVTTRQVDETWWRKLIENQGKGTETFQENGYWEDRWKKVMRLYVENVDEQKLTEKTEACERRFQHGEGLVLGKRRKEQCDYRRGWKENMGS